MNKDYFDSIENIPIWNWDKVTSGNSLDLSYLLKERREVKDVEIMELYSTWMSMQNEYISAYGLPDEYIELLELQKEWILKKTEELADGIRFAKTEVAIIEEDMQSLKKKDSVKLSTSLIFLEEKLKRPLDPHEITAKKFFDYCEHYNKY